MNINMDHIIDTIRAVDSDMVMRYRWSAWRERWTILPKRDINGKRIWGKVWYRERWTIDQRVISRAVRETQWVGNVFDMIRVEHSEQQPWKTAVKGGPRKR